MGEDEIEEIFDRIKERLPSYGEAERELVRRLVDETISPIMVLPRNDEMDRVLDGILYCSKRLGTRLNNPPPNIRSGLFVFIPVSAAE